MDDCRGPGKFGKNWTLIKQTDAMAQQMEVHDPSEFYYKN